MSEQLELLTDNPSQWNAVCYVTPDIQKKEIKPFVICKFIGENYYIYIVYVIFI